MKSRRDANVEATRAALLAAARKRFARDGYSKSEIGRIAADAGVTTGAVYHHFSGKKALFQAVAEKLEREILAASAVDGENPLRRLRSGFERLVETCAANDIQRIIFVEAPQVIGPEAWREIELRYAFGALREILGTLRKANAIKPYPTELVARMLLALLRESSAELARTKSAQNARKQVFDLISSVFDALLAPGASR